MNNVMDTQHVPTMKNIKYVNKTLFDSKIGVGCYKKGSSSISFVLSVLYIYLPLLVH